MMPITPARMSFIQPRGIWQWIWLVVSTVPVDVRQNCMFNCISAVVKLKVEHRYAHKIFEEYDCRWYEYQGDPDVNNFISFRMIFVPDKPYWNQSVKTCDEKYDVSSMQGITETRNVLHYQFFLSSTNRSRSFHFRQGLSACSCVDCPTACPVMKLVEKDAEFVIFGHTGYGVLVAILLIVFTLIVIVAYGFSRRRASRKGSVLNHEF